MINIVRDGRAIVRNALHLIPFTSLLLTRIWLVMSIRSGMDPLLIIVRAMMLLLIGRKSRLLLLQHCIPWSELSILQIKIRMQCRDAWQRYRSRPVTLDLS